MSVFYAPYHLKKGYVDNWIVAGPQAIPVEELDRFTGDDYRLQIARHYYTEDSGIVEPPVDTAKFTLDDTELRWTYTCCREDHFVDQTAFYHTCHYLRSWACTRVVSPTAQEVTLILTTNGPADVWLNGEHVHRQEHFHRQTPHSVSFQATFQEGHNDILVRFEEVAARDCPYAMALQVIGLPEDPEQADVFIPTSIESIARRSDLETAFEKAYITQEVYVFDEKVEVLWPEEMPAKASLTTRFQTPAGRIYGQGDRMATGGNRAATAIPFQIYEDYYIVRLMPRSQEYYEGDMRILRDIGLWTVKNKYSQQRYDTYTNRRVEALYDAFRRETGIYTDLGIYAEIAKMAVDRWHDIKVDTFLKAIDGINQRKDCSDFYLVGLLGVMIRHGENPSFPEELKQPLEECVLNFKYWADEPGEDAMWFWSENHQILFHACEILAGQLYPDRTFTNNGQTGQWHRKKGEKLATAWLHKRGTDGFQEWDSNCYFEEDLLALSHLIDLTETPQVYELAAVVMDKMFFTMALNSYKGTFGSTHGRSYAQMITGGRLEPTAGISRLMWGMGAFNPHIKGPVSLAIQENYQLPPIIEAIAADLPEEMWNREHHAGEFDEALDRRTRSWEVNKVTYKTPDYMLCSAQDYRPGEKGSQEHIWQATMGPDAVVFVNHPPCISKEGSHRPNFWSGNAILPRAAQWKDVLIAVHNMPDDDWLGFTHAYFPAHAFDEYVLREDANGHTWAFAKKDDGYLAITAAQGVEFVTAGEAAYRELRSYGLQNVWLCHMGRATLDGEFAEFQDKVLALGVTFDDLSVSCTTLRGETLAFGWEGPLTRDGEEEPITGFKHYENPYCVTELSTEQMEIRYGDQAMRLNFAV